MCSLLYRRFEGEAGEEALIAALARQVVVGGDRALAERLVRVAEVIDYARGAPVMMQGEPGADIYLVLAGQVSIQVNGREIVTREAGEHVGEMALIDPSARRSASVFACDDAVLARVSEPDFTQVARDYPEMGRVLARELGDRLRARDRLVPARNAAPQLLVVAATDAVPMAKQLHALLEADGIDGKLWPDPLFGAEDFVIDAVQSVLETTDFVVLVLGEGNLDERDRDNAIFELGLFIGLLGRERVVLVVPEGGAGHVPAGLVAPSPLVVRAGPAKDLPARLEPIRAELVGFIATRGPR